MHESVRQQEELQREELKTLQSPDPDAPGRQEVQRRFDLLFRELLRASDDLFLMIGAYTA